MKKYFFSLLLILIYFVSFSQGVIKGRVYNQINNEPLPFASVLVQEANKGTTTDEAGKFEITGLEPGLYNVIIEYIGFERKVISEVQVSNAKPAILEIGMREKAIEAKEITVKASPFERTAESPVSKRTIGVTEIMRSPGGNMDISNVLQSLPGVASTVSFRNDLIIRGGAPNENRFYIDGIEVPNINHFATQGATGGPVGMINVNFIREVDFFAGAFPVNRYNALSSVLDIKFKEGRNDHFGLTGIIGASEAGVSIEGPAGKDFTYLFSVRRSYLQFLFQVFELPFLPTYNDVNIKLNYKIDRKNQITFLGIGALDDLSLNKDANKTEEQRYLLNYLPENDQWNYTSGIKYTHFGNDNYTNVIASRYHLSNEALKYKDNTEDEDNLILNYKSEEIENQFRVENVLQKNGYKFLVGANYGYSIYRNSTFNKINTFDGIDTVNYSTDLSFHNFGLYGQISRSYFENKISFSLGLRTDANTYSMEMKNFIDQLSPRFSFSWQFLPAFALNFNTGIYYQKPPYTVLGYKESGELVNKKNGIKYIQCVHFVSGVEYLTNTNTKISIEGFYKKYNDYPFLLDDSISLANLGSDFGVIGNSPAEPTSKGRAYGIEVYLQQKLYKGFYGILAYTLVRSEFTDKSGKYVPSAWDNKHIISITGGKKFKKNWEIGFRWSLLSGAPYTPYDVELSSRKEVWDITGQGIPDYGRLNTKRLPVVHQLDVRIDKKFFFNKFNLDVYLDIQNVYGFSAMGQPNLTVQRDAEEKPIIDPDNPDHYKVKYLDNEIGTVLPSIGLIIEL